MRSNPGIHSWILFSIRSPTPPASGPALVTWPTHTEQEQSYLVLDLKPRVERRYRPKKMAVWNELVPKVAEFLKKSDAEKKKENALKDEL